MSDKTIVLDANILIRAVLGKRVRELIFDHITTVKFFAPDVAYADARKYLPTLLKKRGVDPSAAMQVLDHLDVSFNPFMQYSMKTCNSKHYNALQCVMQPTGRCWHVP